jgi:hypothetical protein
MCSLFINDLDAGAGRMGDATQYTVNNQMVNATLMNIADNPTNVQLPGVYKNETIPRVPIICTGEPGGGGRVADGVRGGGVTLGVGVLTVREGDADAARRGGAW